MVKYLKQEKLFSKSLPQLFPPKSGNQKKAGHGSVQQNGTSYKTAWKVLHDPLRLACTKYLIQSEYNMAADRSGGSLATEPTQINIQVCTPQFSIYYECIAFIHLKFCCFFL